MLINKNIKIKLRSNLLEYYSNLNYNTLGQNVISVDVHDLHKGSGIEVEVMCDNCGKILILKYKDYSKVISRYNDNMYYCMSCKYMRIKQTNLKRYGVENVMNVEEIKKKSEDTQLRIYGTIPFFDKDKRNNTILSKYGSVEKYYNLTNESRKMTCLSKYGVENVMQNREIKQKNEHTCLSNNGVINPMYNIDIINKSVRNQIKTKLERELIIPSDQLSDFKKYKKIIRRLLYKYKSDIFETWDGYDYYDDEYIKDNLSLNSSHKNYPTIDHKISVYYGFKNNIIPLIIGDVSNLCITKRSLNSKKWSKNSNEFKKESQIK